MTRIIAFLLIIIGVLGLAFSVRAMLSKSQPINPAQTTPKMKAKSRIIILNKDMKRWDLIRPDDLKVIEVEDEKKLPEELEDSVRNRESICGKPLSHDKKAFSALTLGDIILTGNAAAIPLQLESNHVAISVKIGSGSAILDLVKPGEIVGLIVSVKFSQTVDHLSPRSTSLWVIDAARVIAVGSQASHRSESAFASESTSGSIIVEVTAEQARKILTASNMGEIDVAIRSIASQNPAKASSLENVDVEGSGPNASHTQKQAGEHLLLQDRIYREDKKHVMRIISGNELSKEYSW